MKTKLLSVLLATAFVACSPQPALAADFIYNCKQGYEPCNVVLQVTLKNELLQARAANQTFYWCNGWNTESACRSTGTFKALDGEFTTQELTAAGFTIETDSYPGWFCKPTDVQ